MVCGDGGERGGRGRRVGRWGCGVILVSAWEKGVGVGISRESRIRRKIRIRLRTLRRLGGPRWGNDSVRRVYINECICPGVRLFCRTHHSTPLHCCLSCTVGDIDDLRMSDEEGAFGLRRAEKGDDDHVHLVYEQLRMLHHPSFAVTTILPHPSHPQEISTTHPRTCKKQITFPPNNLHSLIPN